MIIKTVLEFLTLYDKQNIRTFSVNIKLIRTRMFHARKARQSLADLPVSKARTNILYIFSYFSMHSKSRMKG
jgi:hypothetical protein